MFYSFIYSGAYCDRTWAQCSLQPLGDGQQQEFKRFTIVNIRWFHNQCTSVPDQAQMSPLGKGNKTIILYRNHYSILPLCLKYCWKCRHVCFVFESLGHQGIFSLVKGTQWGSCYFMLRAFQGHQGNAKGAWRQDCAFVASVKYQAWSAITHDCVVWYNVHMHCSKKTRYR